MAETDLETRNDILYAHDLREILCEKTAQEFRSRWERSHPRPPFSGVGLTALMAIGFGAAGMGMLSNIFVILTVLQLLWVAWAIVVRGSSRTAAMQQGIRGGHFPPDCAPILFARLRWWNQILVPSHWARHSRLHDHKSKLQQKCLALAKRIEELKAERLANQQAVAELPKPDILTLSARISNLTERVEHEKKIGEVQDELLRRAEEHALYQALLHKVQEVTDKLDRIHQLGLLAQRAEAGALDSIIPQALAMLDERRMLVQQVDLVDPEAFLALVRV